MGEMQHRGNEVLSRYFVESYLDSLCLSVNVNEFQHCKSPHTIAAYSDYIIEK